jgi:predicted O-methyltransferase YrrM
MASGAPRWLAPSIADYADAHTAPPSGLQRRLIAETAALGRVAGMQISPLQGAFMEVLVRAIGARRALEVGTFTGYSALCIALGLPADGRLICCDVNETWTAIGRRYWDEAGVGHKIELRIGPAIETLRAMPAQEQFDVAFIDADKSSYPAYVDEIVPRLRTGGLILVDNTLRSGTVADPKVVDDDTVAMRRFNDTVAADPRVVSVLLPRADGLTLLLKR